MGLMEYAHDTWFMRLNHERALVMSMGFGKFLMASRSFGDGVIPEGGDCEPGKCDSVTTEPKFF